MQKYDKIVTSNQSMSSYINNLLIQLAEQRKLKKSYKKELKLYQKPPFTPKITEKTGNFGSFPEKSDLSPVKMLIFNAVSASKSILRLIDRSDFCFQLGPPSNQLEFTENTDFPGLDHCISVLLLVEKKVKHCLEVIFQRNAVKSGLKAGKTDKIQRSSEGKRGRFAGLEVKTGSQSVSNIKAKLYSSHFVEDFEPESGLLTGKSKRRTRMSLFLTDVAKVHYEVSSKITQTKSATDLDLVSLEVENQLESSEAAYLQSEMSRIKQRFAVPSHKPSFSALVSPMKVRTKKVHHRYQSELDVALGVPHMTKEVQELSHKAVMYQKSLQNSPKTGLKEIYQDFCLKK